MPRHTTLRMCLCASGLGCMCVWGGGGAGSVHNWRRQNVHHSLRVWAPWLNVQGVVLSRTTHTWDSTSCASVLREFRRRSQWTVRAPLVYACAAALREGRPVEAQPHNMDVGSSSVVRERCVSPRVRRILGGVQAHTAKGRASLPFRGALRWGVPHGLVVRMPRCTAGEHFPNCGCGLRSAIGSRKRASELSRLSR